MNTFEPLTLTPSPLNNAKRRQAVAIVGLDTKTRAQTPWNDEAFDVWGINGAHRSRDIHRDKDGRFRADRWFQIHPPSSFSWSEWDWFRYLPALQVSTFVRPTDLVGYQSVCQPYLVPYPIDRVKAAFSRGLFASTFCLAIALALHEGYQEIALFGVDSRGLGRELVVERPALTYWQGRAHERGVNLWFPETSTVGVCPYVYGFEYLEEAGFAAMTTEEVIPHRWLHDHEDDSGNLNTLASVKEAAAHGKC